jgi:hypothetical protein
MHSPPSAGIKLLTTFREMVIHRPLPSVKFQMLSTYCFLFLNTGIYVDFKLEVSIPTVLWFTKKNNLVSCFVLFVYWHMRALYRVLVLLCLFLINVLHLHEEAVESC